MNTISRRLPLEMVTLGFLLQGPAHGYDLYARVEKGLGPFWRIGMSHLYGALKQLQREELVHSSLLPQEKRPPRKVYTITPAGREVFLAWATQPVRAVRDIRVEFLAKLYFHRMLGLEKTEQLLMAQAAFLRERLEQIEAALAQTAPDDFLAVVLDLRRRQTAAILDWLETLTHDAEKEEATITPGGPL